MMTHVFKRFFVVAAAVAVSSAAAGVARADIDWIFQQSSSLSMSLQLGTPDSENPETLLELYNGVTQTDPGTGLFSGFTNGLTTYAIGTMTSKGNNFLQVLNFGDEPVLDPDLNVARAQAKTVTANSGNWLPNPADGTSFPGFYGDPVPQNLGAAMVPVPGYPENGTDGGRASLSDAFGTISNGTGERLFPDGPHAAVPMTVDSAGQFNAQSIAITGSLQLNVNYNGTQGQIAFTLPSTGTAEPEDNSNPAGFITRGVGANSYQYIINIPLPVLNDSGITGGLYFNIGVNYNLVAAANLRPGDITFDGIVNGQDIATIASNWLDTNAAKLGPGDANGDGIVNGQDIAIIASNWLGTTPALPANILPPIDAGDGPGNAVPEPSTWVLLGLGSLGMAIARRRAAR